jgi:hypothetical protein
MQYFLGICKRLSHLDTVGSPGHGRGTATGRFKNARYIALADLLHNNIYHTRRLFDLLLAQTGGVPLEKHVGHALANARKTWLRMIAVIAFYYSGVAEPGYILSVTERLLNDLITCFSTS